jgi:hypothetical protein
MSLRRLALMALLLVACTRTRQVPGMVVRVVSDLEVPGALDAVELTVRLMGGQRDVVTETIALDPSARDHTALPFFYGLYPQHSGSDRFTVTAIGKLGGEEVVRRSATTSFPRLGPSVQLTLSLLAACRGTSCNNPGETCFAATVCRPDEVLPDSLPAYRRGGAGADDLDAQAPPMADAADPSADRGSSDQAPRSDTALDVQPMDSGAEAPAPDSRPPGPDIAVDLGPVCLPAPEDCFNGVDDDCDGLADCADPDCVPSVAQCVPADALADPGTAMGASVPPTATCPVNFDKTAATTIRTGLAGGACNGCSCGPSPTTCGPATIFTYKTAAECTADSSNVAGYPISPPSLTPADGCKVPMYMDGLAGMVYGLRVAAIPPVMGACPPAGTASPGPATWASTVKFCPTAVRGAGCAAGQVCVPRIPNSSSMRSCILYSGAHACPAGTTRLLNSDWYTGASDTRSCGACSCVSPRGGSCAGLSVHIGNDYTCDPNDGDVAPGKKLCFSGYVPGLKVNGTASNGTCTPSSATAGAITPTGPRTVCCL